MSWAAFWREPILGITNPEFSGLARSLGRESNASRNLYRYILRKNKALPIPITFVQTPVRKKKNVKVKIIPWPCMLLTDWVKVCMEDPKYRGRFFLGGHTLDTLEQAEDMLETFWHRYAKVETALSPTHPRRTIPVFLHGDEGRGLVHRNTFNTRMLFTVVPSAQYAPDGSTLQCLMETLTQDLNRARETGIEVCVDGKRLTWWIQFAGTKGDWPFLRSCYKLYSGFTSLRVCHACSGVDWYDVSAGNPVRSMPKGAEVEDPFHQGDMAAIRFAEPIEFGQSVRALKIDIAHCYAISGFGKDDIASTLVFLAVRCSIFGHASFEAQLEEAFCHFKEWTRQKGKRTTVTEFSKTTLKISSLQDFPAGLGKGSDCAVISAWLEFVLQKLSWEDVPEQCRDLLQVVKWGNASANAFFRLVYSGSTWLDRQQAKLAVQHGWAFTDTW
ncbi:unnamed protein product [Durusdinium trenchii]|uniref:Uncharacterized protein n=2 Tax=Durusdinium trenchii TaxID=1381693 RepID=A0ABP0R881_9DINO